MAENVEPEPKFNEEFQLSKTGLCMVIIYSKCMSRQTCFLPIYQVVNDDIYNLLCQLLSCGIAETSTYIEPNSFNQCI